MIDQIRRKLDWSSLNRVERLALVGSASVWLGVLIVGAGLVLAIRDHRFDQQAAAQATAIAATDPEPTGPADAASQRQPASTPTPLPPASPTPVRYAVGWATATATATLWATATPDMNAWPILRPRASMTPASEGSLLQFPLRTAPTPTPISGPPDRLKIPSIDLDAPVVPIGWYVVEQGEQSQIVWQVADNAVSWHKTSAYPGQGGNVVLNGHHNIKGEVFRYLVDVEVGDRVLVYVADQVYYYAVEQKMILKEKGEPLEVRLQNASWILPTEEERLTMVTCWPYTNNTHRLVVVAVPIPPPDEGLAGQ
jgi:sortase A